MNLVLVLLSCLFMLGNPEGKDTRITFKTGQPGINRVTLSVKGQESRIPFDGKQGTLSLSLEDSQYVTLSYGDKKRKLFLIPGKDLTATWQGEDKFVFEGENANDNEVLDNPNMDSFVLTNGYALWNKEKSWEDICSENQKRPELMNCSADLREMELARTRCAELDNLMTFSGVVYRDKLMMKQGTIQEFSPKTREQMFKSFGNKYASPDKIDFAREVTDHLIIDGRYLENRGYTQIIMNSLALLLRFEGQIPVLDAIYQRVNYGLENWKDKYVNSHNIESVTEYYVSNFGFEGTEELRTLYKKHVLDENKIKNLENLYEASLRMVPGAESPNFTFLDAEGKNVELTSFQGKYVYIDVWATWCGPCRAEIPFLQKLEEKYAENNIYFLGISVDAPEQVNSWLKMIQNKETAGKPLRVYNNDFPEYFQIMNIPRFILLDKEGKVIDARMTAPSDKKTAEVLEALPGF